MKKILCIINTKFVIGGGLTNAYMNYYERVNHQKFKIDFASSNKIDRDLLMKISKNNSKYFELPKRKKIIKYVKELSKIIKSEKYDAVHIHGNSSTMALEIFAAKKTKVEKIIIHNHNTRNKHPFINWIFNKYINENSNYRLACSKMSGEYLYSKNFYVINNCINHEKFNFNSAFREEIRKKYNIEDDCFLFGTVGRLNEQKNQKYLIKNLKEILNEKNKLLIVGEGPLEKKLIHLCKKNKIEKNIIFAGFQKDIYKYMSAFDMFVFSSKYEGFGMVLLEAQLNGLICVAPTTVPITVNCAGLCEFYNLKDTNEFKKKILGRLQYDKIGREKLSMLAQKNTNKNGFDVDDNVKLLEEIYSV